MINDITTRKVCFICLHISDIYANLNKRYEIPNSSMIKKPKSTRALMIHCYKVLNKIKFRNIDKMCI